MKSMNSLLIASSLLIGFSVQAEEMVLCINSDHAPVMEDNMQIFAFSGDKNEKVALFQGWGENEKSVQEKGVAVKYVKAQFLDHSADNNIGWVKQSYLKPISQCASYKAPAVTAAVAAKIITNSGAGLSNANCCRFPLASSAKADFTQGMRQFGWNRDGGARKHAASDLYHRDYEPIYAIADGVVLRDREAFYGGTMATEIVHTGGFTARYGEIASNKLKPIKLGKTVKAGQLIGYIRTVKLSGRYLANTMLHFELYSGKAKGALTVAKALPYQRRSDLLNPAPYLQKWESSLN